MKIFFYYTTFALLFVSGVVRAQQVVKGERISEFMSAVFSGKLSVELIPADENKVTIELHNADINKLNWGVSDGVLSVRLKPDVGLSGSGVVQVWYKAIDHLSLNGAEAVTQGTLTAHMLTIDLSGGAKLTSEVEAMDLELKLTGNSVAQLTGTSKYLTLKASMRSKADLRRLQTVNAEVSVATNSEVYVHSGERLVADANTSSTIFYLGNPTIFKYAEKMGSSIHNIGAKPQ